MELHVSSAGVGNCSLSQHDGPGALSMSLLYLNSANIPGVSMVSTSAYWVFLAISFPDSYVTDINLTLFIRLDMYSYKSDCMRNIVYSEYYEIPVPNKIISLHVNTFIFSGPDTLSDIPSQRCQYGGLVVRLDLTKKLV